MKRFLSLFLASLLFIAPVPVHAFGSTGCDTLAAFLTHADTSSFVDEDCPGNLPKTVTNTGSVTVNTTNFKFGGGSIGLDGTTKYLSIANDADFNWATDFTVDCWIRTTDKTSDVQFRTVWSRGSTVTGGSLQLSEDTSGFLVVIDSSGGGTVVIQGATDVSDGLWHHAEVARSGTNETLALDGVKQGNTYVTAENYNQNALFYIGIYAGTLNTGRWNGQVDEVRVSPGIDRHTLFPFKVATSPYCMGCEMMEVLQ